MKNIDKENYKDLVPNGIDIKMAQFKQLADDTFINDHYCLLENLYRNLLEQYICQKTSLKKYDLDFLESPLHFDEIENMEKDFYQYYSNLKYFYVRNTLYIERLSTKDLNILIQKYNQRIEQLDSETLGVIERTFRDIITTNVKVENMAVKNYTNYGPLSETYLAPVDALVLGFRYDTYKESKQEDDDAWFEKFADQKDYMRKMFPEIEESLQKDLSVSVALIEYSEESIKKKDDLTTNKQI